MLQICLNADDEYFALERCSYLLAVPDLIRHMHDYHM